jgi:hypothetical protein
VVIKEEVLLKDGISGKFFANNYARRWHALCFAVVNNQRSCCENTKKKLKEEQNQGIDKKESSIESSNLEDFISFQTPNITIKDQRYKLR